MYILEEILTEDDEEYEDASLTSTSRPQVSLQSQAPGPQNQSADIPPDAASAPWVMKLLATVEQVNETNRMLVASHKRTREEDTINSGAKAKKGKITEPDPKDPANWVRGQFEVEDNGSNLLGGLALRVALGGVSADPKIWYAGLDDIVKLPRRGSSLVTGHLLGSRFLHPQVIFDLHDRCAFINYRRLLKVNNGAVEEPRTGMALDEDTDLYSTVYTVSKTFKSAKSVFEVVQGLQAWQAAIHLIRPHSYEAMVLLSALTECRFLVSVAPDKKTQVETLTKVWQEVLDTNQAKARTLSPPLTHKECVQEIKVKISSYSII